MRGGAHEGTAPAVDLLEQARPQRLLVQLGPVDGERRLVGESAEQAALTLHQLHVLEHQHPDRSVAHHQRHRHPPWAGVFSQPEGPGLSAARRDRCDVFLGQRLARAGGDPQHRPESASSGVATRQYERRPERSEDALHRCHHVGQKLRHGEIADQRLRQFVQPLGLVGPAFRLLAGTPELGHDLGDDQDDHRVKGERDPVLRRADGERVVGREEEEVVDDEPAERTYDAGQETADDDPDQCGQHEDQGRDGDAQVGPEGKQNGQERTEASQGDDDPHGRPLVRSLGTQPAWSVVRHRIPSFGSSRECTDALAGPGQTRWR